MYIIKLKQTLRSIYFTTLATKVYPFDKGTGFTLLNYIDDISKIEEQLGKSKIIDYNPTNLLTGKFKDFSENLEKKANLIKRRTQ